MRHWRHKLKRWAFSHVVRVLYWEQQYKLAALHYRLHVSHAALQWKTELGAERIAAILRSMLAAWREQTMLHLEDRRRWKAAVLKHRGVWNNNELRRYANSRFARAPHFAAAPDIRLDLLSADAPASRAMRAQSLQLVEALRRCEPLLPRLRAERGA